MDVRDGQEIDALQVINAMITIYEVIPKRCEDNSKRIAELDYEMSDIVHLIELSKFDAYTGYLHAKKLQDNRTERRKCKDENLMLNHLYNKFLKPNLNKNLNELNNIKRETEKNAAQLHDRSYFLHSYDELKEAFDRAGIKLSNRG